MKKIITILLAFTMLFAFVACDPVTDSKPPVNNTPPAENTPPVDNKPSTDENQNPTEDNKPSTDQNQNPTEDNNPSTDQNQNPEESEDPFEILEETLIQRVLDEKAFDLSGIWNFEYTANESLVSSISLHNGKGYMTVEDGMVKETFTYYENLNKFESLEKFNEFKEELESYLDSYKNWDIEIDDTNLTITLSTTNETALEAGYKETSLEIFLDKYLLNARTNESRTAFKYGFDDNYSYTYIKQGADVKPTDTPKPDFAAIEATLTVPLASFEDVDFTGTWDFMKTMDYSEDNIGTELYVGTGYFNVANDKVSMTYTSVAETYILYDDDLYNMMKEDLLEDGFKYDDATKTLTFIASPANLAYYYDEKTLSDFVEWLNEVCDGTTITTNEAKTAFKFTSKGDYTFTYIKR